MVVIGSGIWSWPTRVHYHVHNLEIRHKGKVLGGFGETHSHLGARHRKMISFLLSAAAVVRNCYLSGDKIDTPRRQSQGKHREMNQNCSVEP